MKYKCIIFDCDGVLVDSEGISFMVLHEMAKEQGLKLSKNEIKDGFSGMDLKLIFKYIEDLLGKKLPDNFTKSYRQRTYAKFKTDIKAVEGIRPLLKSIDIPICVASSGPQEKIRLNLNTTKLIDFFEENIFSAYDIQKWKPHPDIFLHAATKMGFSVEDCAVIEDSLAGIQAGIRGGFDVFAYSNERNQNSFSEAGAVCFNSMSDLPNLWAKAPN